MEQKSYNSNLKNLAGTFAVEGMKITENSRKNLRRLAEGRATCSDIVEELKRKYMQGI